MSNIYRVWISRMKQKRRKKKERKIRLFHREVLLYKGKAYSLFSSYSIFIPKSFRSRLFTPVRLLSPMNFFKS
jgi:alkylated DNA repair dioxygenase AlkB